MTAQTPIYGLKYIVEGEPARNARQALEDNAKTIEAALQSQGVPAVGAPDLATLSGRVSQLEPGAWVALTLTTGAVYTGWPAPRARLERAGVVRFEASVSTISAGVPFLTLPVQFRPNGNRVIVASSGATTSCLGQIQTNGQVIAGATIASNGFLLMAGTYSLT